MKIQSPRWWGHLLLANPLGCEWGWLIHPRPLEKEETLFFASLHTLLCHRDTALLKFLFDNISSDLSVKE